MLFALATLALPATSGADRVGQLRSARTALEARRQAATLQLYAIDSSLDHARARLAEVESALASTRHQRDLARQQLRIAKRSLAAAEASLGEQLRLTYEQGSPDTLSVLFGAASLDQIISGLDNLNQTAASTGAVVDQTRRARAAVRRTLASLGHRAARLAQLRADTAARTDSLVQAQAARTTYIATLRTREQLTAESIARIELQARQAEAASTVATVGARATASLSSLSGSRTAPAPPPPPPPAVAPAPPAAPTPVQPAAGSGRQLTVVATAYSLHGGTASGLPTGPGVVAVDPTVIPLGTRMYIPSYGDGIAADTGTAIKGLRIDLWFPTLAQTYQWGKRTVTITLR
jgi:3D (Asp-Asp-Asp) domain-containing protein/peptidoglycan hydrolase CwlO-like protein